MYSCKAVFGSHFGDIKKLCPFHDSMKLCHHMSLMKESVSVTVESREDKEVDRSIILRRKVRPGGTTLAAKERRPISDKRSHLWLQISTAMMKWLPWSGLVYLVVGRPQGALYLGVYPEMARRVAGPSSLSSAIGMLRILNSHLISSRFWAHSSISWAWSQLQVANTPSFGAKPWQKIALVWYYSSIPASLSIKSWLFEVHP